MSTTDASPSRQMLTDTLVFQLARELSTQTVLFHAAVAEHLGLSQGDHKALDLINDADHAGTPMTAGQLAKATGLTTGAVTGVLDRLEQARLVSRIPDVGDRRKVVLRATHARDQELVALLSGMALGMTALAAHYTDDELAVIVDFVRRTVLLTVEETRRLRGETGVSPLGVHESRAD